MNRTISMNEENTKSILFWVLYVFLWLVQFFWDSNFVIKLCSTSPPPTLLLLTSTHMYSGHVVRYDGMGYMPKVHGERGDLNLRVGNPVWPDKE